MMQEHVLDVSELEPPEPLERALFALEELERGEYLRMLHGREPFPLYSILEERGFSYETRAGKNTNYEILIWHRGDVEAEQAIRLANNEQKDSGSHSTD